MEDVFSVAYQQTEDEKDLEYAYFGIFDGHGGREAAIYAKTHLMDAITSNRNFWSEDDQLVLKAIREGFLTTQKNMWQALPSWKKTTQGHPSTAGTTASVCFIKRGKLFIGHVGDSGIVLGERDPHHPSRWRAKSLTKDHKPDCSVELARIKAAGGKVVEKAGVPRVVWYRPHDPEHRGPVGRSTPIDEVPFLAVARALGDLWSYNAKDDVFAVSPDPDLHVYDVNVLKDRCLVLATDGAWNVVTPDMAVQCVSESEKSNEKHMIDPQGEHKWQNPSKRLVDYAIDRWKLLQLRADNTSIVTVMLDPPGPPRAQVLRKLYGVTPASASSASSSSAVAAAASTKASSGSQPTSSRSADSASSGENNDNDSGNSKANIAIISRFPNSDQNEEKEGKDLFSNTSKRNSPNGGRVMTSSVVSSAAASSATAKPDTVRFVQDSANRGLHPQKITVLNKRNSPGTASPVLPPVKRYIPQAVRRSKDSPNSASSSKPGSVSSPQPQPSHPVPLAARRNGSVASLPGSASPELPPKQSVMQAGVQVPEVSSSNTPPPLPQRNPRQSISLKKGLADLQINASSMNSPAAAAAAALAAVSSGFEGARKTRQNSGQTSKQKSNAENKKTSVTPKAATVGLKGAGSVATTPKTPGISPRILRPRNTPTTCLQSPPEGNIKLISPQGDVSDETAATMKRKRGSMESAVASKMLRSGSKNMGAKSQSMAGIARKNAGATPARLGRK